METIESKYVYLVEELNNDFQCSIPLIPIGTYDTALYDFSVQDKLDTKMWVDSGYNGYKSLEFYGKPPQNGYYFEGKKLGSVIFPNFKTAYNFIQRNKLSNYQLRTGCYKKEVRQYNKELKYGNN